MCAFDPTLGPAGWAITLTSGQEDTDNNFGNLFPPNEGCTPGFWQGGFGINLWNSVNDPQWAFYGGEGVNPFRTTTKFGTNNGGFFEPTGTQIDNWSMLQIVGSGGTNAWPRKAARDLIAAYLNASWGMDYPVDTTQILADWHTAVTTAGTAGYQDFHLKYAAFNQLGCNIP